MKASPPVTTIHQVFNNANKNQVTASVKKKIGTVSPNYKSIHVKLRKHYDRLDLDAKLYLDNTKLYLDKTKLYLDKTNLNRVLAGEQCSSHATFMSAFVQLRQ